MKFYKIIDPEGHNGLIYKEGINTDPYPFNPWGGCCEAGGIYFSREDILAFLDEGTELYEVEPIGEIYEDLFKAPETGKAHSVKLTYVGKVLDNIQMLVKQGADIHANNDYALRWAAENGYLEVAKFLVEQGANIHIWDDHILVWAAENGYLEVVKYLVEQGADIHAQDDYALRWAAHNDHLEVVKYLVEQGADIHAMEKDAISYAIERGHYDVVEYIKSKM